MGQQCDTSGERRRHMCGCAMHERHSPVFRKLLLGNLQGVRNPARSYSRSEGKNRPKPGLPIVTDTRASVNAAHDPAFPSHVVIVVVPVGWARPTALGFTQTKRHGV